MITLDRDSAAILAHVVEDPAGWADHVNGYFPDPEAVLEAKLDWFRGSYNTQKNSPGYKTRAQREAAHMVSIGLSV